MAALVAAFIAGVITVELVTRLVIGGDIYAPLFSESSSPPGYALRPNWHGQVRAAGRLTNITLDGLGHRYLAAATQARPQAPTIYLIGDSQAFGWGLNDYETVGSKLQDMVGSNEKIVTIAAPGWGPPSYLETLSQIDKDAVVVVLQVESNDFWDTLEQDRNVGVHCHRLTSNDSGLMQTPCFLLSSSIFQMTKQILDRNAQPFKAVPIQYNPSEKALAELTAFRIMQFHDAALNSRRGHTVFTVIPWDAFVYPNRRTTYRPILSGDIQAHQKFVDDCGMQGEFFGEKDATQLFLEHDEHLSSSGAELAARVIFRCLERFPQR